MDVLFGLSASPSGTRHRTAQYGSTAVCKGQPIGQERTARIPLKRTLRSAIAEWHDGSVGGRMLWARYRSTLHVRTACTSRRF